MDILIMIACVSITIGLLVFIHEGGHYLAARAFGVRVTEFMLGFPGPSIGFTRWGTRFGITAVPLGGYARVCGMEPGPVQPHLREVLAALYERGTANMEDIAADCGITDDEAYEALEQLTLWGSCAGPTKQDEYNTYRAPAVVPTGRQRKQAARAGLPEPQAFELGQPRPVPSPQALYETEYRQQYRSLPFWKRCVILTAGVAMNLLFVVLVFVFVYSVVGVDLQYQDTGEIVHYNASVWQSIVVSVSYIGMVVDAVVGLFNPQTVAETVSNSTSIVGIAVMSKGYFAQGFESALFFMAMISTSLGIMNLIPIPPLDGGRLLVEAFQKLSGKQVSMKALSYMSIVGMGLFLLLFVFMLNQDIQRLITGAFGAL